MQILILLILLAVNPWVGGTAIAGVAFLHLYGWLKSL